MSTNTNTNRPAPQRNNAPAQIDLIELFKAIIKRWYFIVACAVIGAVAMGYMTNVEVTPLYRSSSMLFVARAGTITSYADIQIGSYLTGDFVVIAKSKPVIDSTIQTINAMHGTNLTRAQVSDAISVEEVEDTHIIKFTVTYTDPQIACDLCNALTDAMADQIAYIMSTDRPTIVERAEVSNYQINVVNNDRQIMMGGVGGAAVCIAVLCMMFMLDDKVKTAEDIEKYIGAPVLVSIPLDKAQTYKSKRSRRSHSSNKSRK